MMVQGILQALQPSLALEGFGVLSVMLGLGPLPPIVEWTRIMGLMIVAIGHFYVSCSKMDAVLPVLMRGRLITAALVALLVIQGSLGRYALMVSIYDLTLSAVAFVASMR